MKDRLEDKETKRDDRHRDDIQWGAGITDMTAEVLAKLSVGEAAPTQEGSKDERNKMARLDGKGLGATQHAGAMQGGEPEKRQLQQHPKPNPKQQLKQQSEQQHEPKPKPRTTTARWWEKVQLRTRSQWAPTGTGLALTSGSGMAERSQIPRRDERYLEDA